MPFLFSLPRKPHRNHQSSSAAAWEGDVNWRAGFLLLTPFFKGHFFSKALEVLVRQGTVPPGRQSVWARKWGKAAYPFYAFLYLPTSLRSFLVAGERNLSQLSSFTTLFPISLSFLWKSLWQWSAFWLLSERLWLWPWATLPGKLKGSWGWRGKEGLIYTDVQSIQKILGW